MTEKQRRRAQIRFGLKVMTKMAIVRIDAMSDKDFKDIFGNDGRKCECSVPKPFGFGAYRCGNFKMKGRRVCWVHRNKEAGLKPKTV